MTYALRIFFIIWYNYKQITIPPPRFGLLDTSGKRHLGDTIFGGTDMRISRQNKILELIETYEIETQEELAEYLNKEGYNVTQATVSRDIRELKLSKIQTENGRQKYAVFHPQTAFNDKYIRILHDSFLSMDMAQNILVIKTVSGMAMAVGAALDSLHFGEIVGCIAGDDTVMCAVRTVDDTIVLMDKIKKLIAG